MYRPYATSLHLTSQKSDTSARVAHWLTSADTAQEYQFRGIQKSEWNNLFNFIQAKRLRIENVAEAEMGPSGAVRPGLDIDLGEDIDTGAHSSTLYSYSVYFHCCFWLDLICLSCT